MKRCLILGCSETKVAIPEAVPAIERYNGPPFRVLRRFLADGSPTNPKSDLDVFILSAEFGLIRDEQPIPIYDRRMSRHRAEELRPGVLETFKCQIATQGYAELFLSMGQTYRLALAGYEALLPPTMKVIISEGPSGRKLTELKAWLTSETPPVQQPLPLDIPSPHSHRPKPARGRAYLQGLELAFTPDEIYQIARQALADEIGNPHNFKDWYVLVDGGQVAPKWLVSQLANLPVSRFDASTARRVLKALGVPVHRNK